MRDKLVLLQILRGLSAWMVVYYHYMQIFYGFQSNSILGQFFSDYGMLGVDIFFIISGFIMSRSLTLYNRHPLDFFISRFLRITPAYWFYTIITVILIEFFQSRYLLSDYSAKSLFLSAFYISNDNPAGTGCFPTLTVGWTLNYEMFFYFILSLCLVAHRRSAIYTCSILFALITFLGFENSQCFCIWSRGDLLIEFALGMMIGKFYLKFKSVSYLINVSLCVFHVLICFSLFPFIGEFLKAKLLFCTTLVSLFVLLERHLQRHKYITRSLCFLGDISYSTYLCHVPILYTSYLLISEYTNHYIELINIIFLTTLIILTSLISFKFIENNTSINRLKKILVKKI